MNLFINTNTNKRVTKRLREEIYYTRINEMSLYSIKKFFINNNKININKIRENINNPADRNFFRFLFKPEQKLLYINYLETPTKNWEKENYLQISKYFEVITTIFTKYKNMNKFKESNY